MNLPPPQRPPRGFTLLELVMAIAIFTMIVSMVLGISRTTLALGNSIVETQNEEMLHQAFFELLSQRFAALPGNTRFDLKSEDSGSHYLSDLTLQNVPLGFSWGGRERVAKAVQLSTVRRRTGYLSIVLRYYDKEILEGSEGATSIVDNEPFAEIELLSDVRFFEWRVLDGRSMDWLYDWDLEGRLPLQAELVMAIGAQGEEIRRVFWIPPKQNPEVLMRQIGMNQQESGAGPGAGGTPGTGDENGRPGGGGGNRPGGGGRPGGDVNITLPAPRGGPPGAPPGGR